MEATQYVLTESPTADGSVLYTAAHSSGQPIDWSRNRDEMAARVDQLNAGQPVSEWAKVWRPAQYKKMIAAQKHPEHTCPTCGLDARRCDCR